MIALTLKSFHVVWRTLSISRKKQIIIYFFLSVFSSALEVVSIGLLVPFLGLIVEPAFILERPLLSWLPSSLLVMPDRAIFYVSGLFVLGIVCSSWLKISLLSYQASVVYRMGTDISAKLYRNTLSQECIDFLNENTSFYVSAIIEKTQSLITHFLIPFFSLISSLLLSLAILVMLSLVDFEMTVYAALLISVFYFLVGYVTHAKISDNGLILAANVERRMRVIQEGFGSFREVFIYQEQKRCVERFIKTDAPIRKAQASNYVISASPRYIIEFVTILSIIALSLFYYTSDADLESIIPLIGAFAIGAHKLIPSLQLIYSSYTSLKTSMKIVDEIKRILVLETINFEKESIVIGFKQELNFQHVFYSYSKERGPVLDDMSLTIRRGEKVGLIGASGGGKSTFVDLLTGVLIPSKGCISVDNIPLNSHSRVYWCSNIAIVPQTVFLFDASIIENITSTVYENVDFELLDNVIELAQLRSIIDDLPEGLFTIVGERGTSLSGGQVQRIAIAKALYKNKPLLILDEATNAVDPKTERAILSGIIHNFPRTTVILIAHRYSSLELCDRVIELANGKVLVDGTVDDVIPDRRLN